MDNRTCSVCGNEFPLDRQHFRWREREGGGFFSAECLLCRANQRRTSKERKKQKRVANLQKIEEAGVDLFLGSLASGGSNIPHSAELLERVFSYFGGTSGFAAVMVKQYWDSPSGGTARNRILETLCRLVTKNAEQGGAKKPLTLWTDDELEQELNKRFEEAVQTFKVVTVHGEETSPTQATPKSLPAPDPVSAVPFAVPEGRTEGHSKRAAGKKKRGAKAVPAEPEPGEDPRLPGE